MKTSIIIPSKDKNNRLRLVMQALENQITDDIEVIVVMDGCTRQTIDEFAALPLSFAPQTVICKENVGRSAARNKGIEQARGDLIIFLDDDRIPNSDFVKQHINAHTPGCVTIGCRKQLYYSEGEINRLYDDNIILKKFDKIIEDSKNEQFDLMGAIYLFNPLSPLRWMGFATGNISLEKKLLLEAGCFDEGFKGWGFEDMELGYRLFKNRVPFIKAPSVINYHLEHPRNNNTKLQEFLNNHNHFKNKFRRDYITQFIVNLLVAKVSFEIKLADSKA